MKLMNNKLFFLFTFLWVVIPSQVGYGQHAEQLTQLVETIERSAAYDALKIERIDSLYNELTLQRDSSLQRRFELNRSLFFEYRIFKQDSAFKYSLASKALAEQLGDARLI
ncbi:MAG TPA: hypothetical protein DEB18_11170, partial [Leeuwenhoekiella sp.]|nr:hypothetical protein [Leeuwenhoekiella sp.]